MIINSLELKNGEIYRNVFAKDYSELESFGFTEDEAKNIWLKQAKVDASSTILETSKKVRDLITGGADYIRIAGWIAKESRARRFMDKVATEVDTKQLQIEASSRGKKETIENLAIRQIFLADQLAVCNAFVDGYESYYTDKINQSINISEIDSLLSEYNLEINKQLKEMTGYNNL